MKPFGDRLAEAVRRAATPAIVGLDPRWDDLPEPIKSAHGGGCLESRAAAYADFCRGVIDVVASLVPAVKPQVAFFEQLGPAGMRTLAETIQYARQRGLLVIADGKRNDIGPTAEAYADAWLGKQSAWRADALTVNPYLGGDTLEPFVSAVRNRDAGVFVLVKTSNPGGGQFQDALTPERPLYRQVAEHVERLASAATGESGYGSVGAVVGATYPAQLTELRAAMPHTWILVPGFGSQGAGARDVAGAFDTSGLGAVINNARGIIFAHRRKEYAGRFAPDEWQAAARAATQEMTDQLRAETSEGRLSAG